MVRLKEIILLTIILVCFSCQKDESYEYIRPELLYYQFASDRDTCSIKINSNIEWDVVNVLPDWLSVISQTADSLVVSVSDNLEKENRAFDIIVGKNQTTAVISISQMEDIFDERIISLYDWYMPVLSRNGRYVAGMKLRYSEKNPNEQLGTPMVMDLNSGIVLEMPEVSASDGYNVINAVSDDGRVLVYSHLGNSNSAVFVDGEKIELDIPERYSYPYYSNISSDGSVIVGWCMRDGAFYPMKWVNREPVLLEAPDCNLSGNALYNGAMARGCSSDGTVIYGSEWDNFGLLYWKDDRLYSSFENEIQYNDKNPLENMYTGVVTFSDRFCISNNGKYIAGNYKSLGNSPTINSANPALLNLETGNIEVVEGVDAKVLTVTDNGEFFGGKSFFYMSDGAVFGFGKEPVSFVDWLSERGLVMLDNNVVFQISDDYKTILGATFKRTVLGVQYQYWLLNLN